MIKTDKPQTLTAEDIERIEAAPENKGRGKVQVLRFPSEVTPDRPATFFVLKPRRQLLEAMAETAEKDKGKANDLLVNGSVIAGDLDQLADDDDLYYGLMKEIGNLVEAKKKL